jgi:hypothetical protein
MRQTVQLLPHLIGPENWLEQCNSQDCNSAKNNFYRQKMKITNEFDIAVSKESSKHNSI